MFRDGDFSRRSKKFLLNLLIFPAADLPFAD